MKSNSWRMMLGGLANVFPWSRIEDCTVLLCLATTTKSVIVYWSR